jgi:hypothetical protein
MDLATSFRCKARNNERRSSANIEPVYWRSRQSLYALNRYYPLCDLYIRAHTAQL